MDKERYFQHFKGGVYKLISIAYDSETLEELVVYQALYGEKRTWVRPKEMFFSTVCRDGEEKERFKEIFRKRKDLYRRQRDLSIFCFIGVYLLSVVDAYVDAELSNFDITDDLSVQVRPTTIENRQTTLRDQAYGLQCSFSF